MTAPYHSLPPFGARLPMALLAASMLAPAATAAPERHAALPGAMAQATPCDRARLEDIRTPETACATAFDGHPALCHAPRVGLADRPVFVCSIVLEKEMDE